MKTINIQSTLDYLSKKNLMEADSESAIHILQVFEKKLPIYIQVLLAIGALMGCWFFVAFLFMTEILSINKPFSLIFVGIFLIGCAFYLYHIAAKSDRLGGFSLQCSSILMLTGKALFVGGFCYAQPIQALFGTHDFMILSTLGALLVTLATYFLYPVDFERFLSCLAFLLLIMLNTSIIHERGHLFYLFYTSLLFISMLLLLWPRMSSILMAFDYASIIVLCFCTIYLASIDSSEIKLAVSHPVPLYFYKITLGAALIFLCLYLSHQEGCLTSSPTLFTVALFFALSFISTPGILLSLIFLLLGHSQHRNFLTVLGTLFLILFLIHYYYSLPISLAHKSFILMLTGIILLFGSFYIKIRKWDKN